MARGKVTALVWRWVLPDQPVSDRPYFTKDHPASPVAPAFLRFTHLRPGAYTLEVHRTGYRANDPQTLYLEMGSPANLSPAQLKQLQQATQDRPERSARIVVPRSGSWSLTLPMRTNDVVLVELREDRR